MRFDLKTWGKLSCRLVVITSEWRGERDVVVKASGPLLATAVAPQNKHQSELLTNACELRVQTDGQEHEEEEDGPEWRDGKLGQSVWICNECQTEPCMTAKLVHQLQKNTFLFPFGWALLWECLTFIHHLCNGHLVVISHVTQDWKYGKSSENTGA